MYDLQKRISQAQQHHQHGKFQQAEQVYKEILQGEPSQAEVWCLLGMVYHDARHFDAALEMYHRALTLRPNMREGHHNMANTLRILGRLDEAIFSFQNAIRLKPDFAEAYNGLAATFHEQNRPDKAVATYQDAIRCDPNNAEAHSNLAIGLFMLGEYAKAWPEYEWRWRTPELRPRECVQPRWDGAPLNGQTILVWAEQGLGDTLEFVRYCKLVQQRGGRVIFESPPALVELLALTPGIDQVIVAGQPAPEFDVHIPLLSLPGVFGTTVPTIPTEVPYIFASPELIQRWQAEIAAVDGYKIGVCWRGNPKNLETRKRALSPADLSPLTLVPGVRLFSLQKNATPEQLLQIGSPQPVIDLAPRLNTFADTAAAMRCLDLIVSIDTSVAHCAGAMGLNVWTTLPFAADWRWFLNRPDSPWYPTMRLFRQKIAGDWSDVFQRVAQALKDRKM